MGGTGKGHATARGGERKGELFFFFFVHPPRTVLPLTFFFRLSVMNRTTVNQVASALKRRHQAASLITQAKW